MKHAVSIHVVDEHRLCPVSTFPTKGLRVYYRIDEYIDTLYM